MTSTSATDRQSILSLGSHEKLFGLSSTIQKPGRIRRDSNLNLMLPPIQIPQCSVQTPEQRVLDLVIVQICQQLRMERFKSYKIIRLLSHVLALQIRSLCLQVNFIHETFSYLQLSSEDVIRMFLVRSGELSDEVSNLGQNSSFFLRSVRPALSELLGYLFAQNSWISSLMNRLASIPDTPSITRRMLPPEALLTLFTTLPRSFHAVSNYNTQKATAISDPLLLNSNGPSEKSTTDSEQNLSMERLEKLDQTEDDEEDDELAKCVDEGNDHLQSSSKLFSSFVYFLNSYEVPSSTLPLEKLGVYNKHFQHRPTKSLIDYVAFGGGHSSVISPTFHSPSSCRSLLAHHISNMLGSPGILEPLFSVASSLHSDPTFILKFFQSYPLAFKTSSNLSGPTSKGRGPSLSSDEIARTLSNFFSPSTSIIRALAASSKSYFELRGSDHIWLGELVETSGSRRRAHFCRTDGISAFTSVIHLSSSGTPLPPSATSSKDGSSLSIIIRTPAKSLTDVSDIPLSISNALPKVPSWINTSKQIQQKKFPPLSFISSRQTTKKKKTKSIKLIKNTRKPIRLILKCDNITQPSLMQSVPKIRIKLPISLDSETTKKHDDCDVILGSTSSISECHSIVPKIRLRVNQTNMAIKSGSFSY